MKLSRVLLPFGLLTLASSLALAQTPTAKPAFEVASVKPAAPINPAQIASGKLHVGMKIDAARVDIGFVSLADLIRTAYEVKPYQISGPDWMKTERFDIVATLPAGGTKEQVPAMLQALLAERFGLTLHKESRQVSVYALVVGKGGAKLKDAEPEPVLSETPEKGVMSLNTADGEVRVKASGDGRGATVTSAKTGTTKMSMGADGMMHMESSRVTMAAFSDTLSPFVDRPVIDRTELKGNYQIVLDLSMADMMKVARASGMLPPGAGAALAGPADAASDPSGDSIFASVQALGLKLEPRKDSVDTIVVDHLEKTPTEN